MVAAPPVRFTRFLWWGSESFDPSGHILLTSIQLIPLWAAQSAKILSSSSTTAASSLSTLRVTTYCFEPLLWWVSIGTASFYHPARDVVATWIVACLLVILVFQGGHGNHGKQKMGALLRVALDTVPSAHGTPALLGGATAPQAAQKSSSSGKSSGIAPRRWVQCALVIWIIECALLWRAARVYDGNGGGLILSLTHGLYDTCVALFALRLSIPLHFTMT